MARLIWYLMIIGKQLLQQTHAAMRTTAAAVAKKWIKPTMPSLSQRSLIHTAGCSRPQLVYDLYKLYDEHRQWNDNDGKDHEVEPMKTSKISGERWLTNAGSNVPWPTIRAAVSTVSSWTIHPPGKALHRRYCIIYTYPLCPCSPPLLRHACIKKYIYMWSKCIRVEFCACPDSCCVRVRVPCLYVFPSGGKRAEIEMGKRTQ